MSHLYASIDSDHGRTATQRQAHRCVTSHTRGWNAGVRTYIEKGEHGDHVRVVLTGGSNSPNEVKLLFSGTLNLDGTWQEKDLC